MGLMNVLFVFSTVEKLWARWTPRLEPDQALRTTQAGGVLEQTDILRCSWIQVTTIKKQIVDYISTIAQWTVFLIRASKFPDILHFF